MKCKVPSKNLVTDVMLFNGFLVDRSTFGVTLDGSVRNRLGQQTDSTSPGRLQFGMNICYNKIKR